MVGLRLGVEVVDEARRCGRRRSAAARSPSGSSVPAWPTRRSPRMRRTWRMASNDVIPAGLSSGRTPPLRATADPGPRAGPGRGDAGHRCWVDQPASHLEHPALARRGAGRANSAPAARRWPPPPNGVQTSVASNGSRVRTLILMRSAAVSLKRIAICMVRDALERVDDALGVLHVRAGLLEHRARSPRTRAGARPSPSASPRRPGPRGGPARGSATCSS